MICRARALAVFAPCLLFAAAVAETQAPEPTPTPAAAAFQMPAGLPFTIESVGSGADYVKISGRVAWEADAAGPAQTPAPQ